MKTKKKGGKKKMQKVVMKYGAHQLLPDFSALVPPPSATKHCPRCGGEHNLKVQKFTKPVEFFGTDLYGAKVLTARCSHWAMCPKTKEPVILFDRYVNSSNIEEYVARRSAADIASEIDKELLANLTALKTKPSPSKINARFKDGWTASWTYDPNAPERIVPGTKKQAAEQRARVRAQEASAKKKRK